MIDRESLDVIVIGAGGAGLMCGAIAARRGRRVLLLDHAEKLGKKILISGGGRCNFTNIHASPANYVSSNPHFAKSALSQYKPSDFITMVKRHGIAFHEKKLGQLFCDGSAQQIVDMLIAECTSAGANFLTGCKLSGVTREDGKFEVATTHGSFTSRALVVATGGLSIPKIGATGFGYDLARQFGLAVTATAPALVGLEWNEEDCRRFEDLAGVALDSTASCKKISFRENTLFTHGGLSGPAILQASLYWHPGDPITLDLAPETELEAFLMEQKREGATRELKNVLKEVVPKRLAERLCEVYLPSRPLNSLADKKLADLATTVKRFRFLPARAVGYQKAEVTRGGVDTAELSSRTMEAKKVPGLYFIGEVVDVTGQLGGYNFQWAWASAHAAAQNV